MYRPQLFGSEDFRNNGFDSSLRTVQVLNDPIDFLEDIRGLLNKYNPELVRDIDSEIARFGQPGACGVWSVAYSTGNESNLRDAAGALQKIICGCYEQFVKPEKDPSHIPDYEWVGHVVDIRAANYCMSLNFKDSGNDAHAAWREVVACLVGKKKNTPKVASFRALLVAAMQQAPGCRLYGFVYDPGRLEPSASLRKGLRDFAKLTMITISLPGDGFIARAGVKPQVLRFLSWAAAMQVAYGFKSEDDMESLDAQQGAVLSKVRDVVDDSRFLSHYRSSSPEAIRMKQALAQPNNVKNMDLSFDGGGGSRAAISAGWRWSGFWCATGGRPSTWTRLSLSRRRTR